jgi:hypothetical protein
MTTTIRLSNPLRIDADDQPADYTGNPVVEELQPGQNVTYADNIALMLIRDGLAVLASSPAASPGAPVTMPQDGTNGEWLQRDDTAPNGAKWVPFPDLPTIPDLSTFLPKDSQYNADDVVLGSKQNGDTNRRFLLDGSGRLLLGDGVNPEDRGLTGRMILQQIGAEALLTLIGSDTSSITDLLLALDKNLIPIGWLKNAGGVGLNDLLQIVYSVFGPTAHWSDIYGFWRHSGISHMASVGPPGNLLFWQDAVHEAYLSDRAPLTGSWHVTSGNATLTADAYDMSASAPDTPTGFRGRLKLTAGSSATIDVATGGGFFAYPCLPSKTYSAVLYVKNLGGTARNAHLDLGWYQGTAGVDGTFISTSTGSTVSLPPGVYTKLVINVPTNPANAGRLDMRLHIDSIAGESFHIAGAGVYQRANVTQLGLPFVADTTSDGATADGGQGAAVGAEWHTLGGTQEVCTTGGWPYKQIWAPAAQISALQTADLARAVPRGTWLPTTSYAVNDVVVVGGFAYRCLAAHTSTSTFPGPGVTWEAWTNGAGFELGYTETALDTTIPNTNTWTDVGASTASIPAGSLITLILEAEITINQGTVTAGTNVPYPQIRIIDSASNVYLLVRPEIQFATASGGQRIIQIHKERRVSAALSGAVTFKVQALVNQTNIGTVTLTTESGNNPTSLKVLSR